MIAHFKKINNMNIGKSIKELRTIIYPNLNAGEFAKLIGVTQAYISLLEANKRKPSLELLNTISEVFKTPTAIIFWFAIEEKEIRKERLESFNIVKPIIDDLIKNFIK